jgi:hypothetical protein
LRNQRHVVEPSVADVTDSLELSDCLADFFLSTAGDTAKVVVLKERD